MIPNILSVITFLPLVGMVLVLLTPAKQVNLIRWGSVLFSTLMLAVAAVLWAGYDSAAGHFQFVYRRVQFHRRRDVLGCECFQPESLYHLHNSRRRVNLASIIQRRK